jgi:copper homeostasis protein
MLADIEACKQLGADGVVLGCLLPDGRIDSAATCRLVAAAHAQVSERLVPARVACMAQPKALCWGPRTLSSCLPHAGPERHLPPGL